MNDGHLKVGITRSGKDILISFIDDLNEQVRDVVENFDDSEIFDCYAVFELCRLKEYRIERRENSRCLFLRDFAQSLRENLRSKAKLSRMRKSLNIVTSIDLVSYARSLVLPEYR